jgi:tRNA(Arg) A34 adenosine deaminase TadA
MSFCPGSQMDWRSVAAPPPVDLTARESEQHSIYLLLAMALVFDGWCVNKTRPEQVQAYAAGAPDRIFAAYLGHNVGALVVDPREGILAFALNRNVELRSTLEHAEARAIRHAINRRNKAGIGGDDLWSFTGLLKGVRIYATLEPCSQCAGIAELANLEAVVYAQDDPFQCGVANVLYNLHLHLRSGAAASPLPIRATFFPLWNELAAAYADFVASKPSHGRTGLTSFLETFQAYAIYREAAERLDRVVVKDPENAIVLEHAQAFRRDRASQLQRGLTPL